MDLPKGSFDRVIISTLNSVKYGDKLSMLTEPVVGVAFIDFGKLFDSVSPQKILSTPQAKTEL